MSSADDPIEIPKEPIAEFFAEIESGDGPRLTADDHRAIVASVRSDRAWSND